MAVDSQLPRSSGRVLTRQSHQKDPDLNKDQEQVLVICRVFSCHRIAILTRDQMLKVQGRESIGGVEVEGEVREAGEARSVEWASDAKRGS